jgi:hypothetical protein
MAPVVDLQRDTTAATPVPAVTAAPVTPPSAETAAAPAPTDAPAETAVAPAPAASGDTRVAAVEPGGSATAGIYGPARPKTEAKPHHRAKVARPHPPKAKKIVQVATGNPRSPPSTAPSTGSQVNQPNNLNNGFGVWRYDSTTR